MWFVYTIFDSKTVLYITLFTRDRDAECCDHDADCVHDADYDHDHDRDHDDYYFLPLYDIVIYLQKKKK
jgi:hypothetical protein